MLVLDEDAKVSTVTSLSDLQLRGQRSKERSNYKMCQMTKVKRVNVLVLDKDAKVTTVISLPDLQLRGQRSKKGQTYKKCQYRQKPKRVNTSLALGQRCKSDPRLTIFYPTYS